MKRKPLFIILCLTTLTFLGCGKTETPVMSNSVETESEIIIENEPVTESEIITTNEITETTTETDTTIEVDINGVDGTIEEGDYDEELHGESENQSPEQGTDEFQQMIEEMAAEIYGDYIDHIPADPEVEEALGGTYGNNELSDPDQEYGQTTNSALVGGSLE